MNGRFDCNYLCTLASWRQLQLNSTVSTHTSHANTHTISTSIRCVRYKSSPFNLFYLSYKFHLADGSRVQEPEAKHTSRSCWLSKRIQASEKTNFSPSTIRFVASFQWMCVCARAMYVWCKNLIRPVLSSTPKHRVKNPDKMQLKHTFGFKTMIHWPRPRLCIVDFM